MLSDDLRSLARLVEAAGPDVMNIYLGRSLRAALGRALAEAERLERPLPIPPPQAGEGAERSDAGGGIEDAGVFAFLMCPARYRGGARHG